MYISGAGGFLVQAIIGLVVAIPIVAAVYRQRITLWFKKSPKPEVTETLTEE